MAAVSTWLASSGRVACEMELIKARFLSDIAEPEGDAAGPSPHEILDSALAACTALTLEFYIRSRGIPVDTVRVAVTHREEGGVYRLNRVISVSGALSDAQRATLLRVAQGCPVHRTLTGDIAINTSSG